jgi:hypothetical protein
MVHADWNELCNDHVISESNSNYTRIGPLLAKRDQILELGAPLGNVAVLDLHEAVQQYDKISLGSCRPQFAAYAFLVTHQPYALNVYFPLTKSLSSLELSRFYKLIQDIIRNRNFDLRLFGDLRNEITSEMPAHVVFLVAGHLAEIFFYRQDILERLLSSPRHLWLYTTPEAFAKDGGIAGGCFNPERGCLQLVLSRLYEGFNDRTPGVAPFLHEFGHMLDHFGARRSYGLLPGMRPEDGAIYTPEAHKLFVQGQDLELKRYLTYHKGQQKEGDLPPIGHPYIFQNGTEFIAGYFEMFFRNPHYFAEMNPDLYQGFALLFKQDPRKAWDQDFPFYIQQNRDFYLKSNKRPGAPGLTIPTS